jgi:hypothetical protein
MTDSISIEPVNPNSKVVDRTKPAPAKPRSIMPGISALQKAGPGWKAQPAPAKPGDIALPAYTGVSKT